LAVGKQWRRRQLLPRRTHPLIAIHLEDAALGGAGIVGVVAKQHRGRAAAIGVWAVCCAERHDNSVEAEVLKEECVATNNEYVVRHLCV